MKLPQVNNSAVNNFCRKCLDLQEKFLVKYFIKPICFTLPATLLMAILVNPNFLMQLKKFLPLKYVDNAISNSLIFFILLTLLFYLFKIINPLLKKWATPCREIKIEDVAQILREIEIVVNSKMECFEKSAREVSNSKKNTSEIFDAIVQPDQQIGLLIHGIHAYFEYLHPNINFRVGLLRIENDKIIKWLFYVPKTYQPKTDIKTLNSSNSSIMRAIKQKQPILIENVRKEIEKPARKDKNYIKGNSHSNNMGSQLTIPIIHPLTKSVEYVISIASDKINSMSGKNYEMYKWILGHFIDRINLEHNLYILKEAARDEE